MQILKELLYKIDIKSVIAVIIIVRSFDLLKYILVHYGSSQEVLMLIIGLIGGTIIGSVLAYYYSGTHTRGNNNNNTTVV